MSASQDLKNQALEDFSQLRDWIYLGAKGPDAILGVGTEHEKLSYANAQGDPIRYGGENGIQAILEMLADRFGWQRQYDGGYLLSLTRDGASVTLEPGGQLELSGAIQRTAFGTERELNNHLDEVRQVAQSLGVRHMFGGMNPWYAPDEIEWLPKPRYGVMRQYLPRRGPMAAWMMKTTACAQANFDYRDGKDAMEMLRIAALVSPIFTALYANSPVRNGEVTGLVSSRMAIWEDTDRDRCGTPAFMLDPEATVDDYVNWVLDVPMFFIQRGAESIDMAGHSFRSFMEQGFAGHRAVLADWELHLSTAFPDVRMKQYIETRTTDCARPGHIVALAAMWKGIFYDAEARKAALALPLARDFAESESFIHLARTEGLGGVFRGTSVRELAESLIEISRLGLSRQATEEGDEGIFLDVFRDESGRVVSPGESFLRDWKRLDGDREKLIALWGLGGL